MELDANTVTVLFWGFVSLVVVGGLVCLMIFLPREHDYENARDNCYRIMYRDGVYSVTRKKPTYGENRLSLRSKYFYITKVPFQLTAVCEDAKTPDGKSRRCAAGLTVCFSEDRLQIFAPTFRGVSQDIIVEMLEEALASAAAEFLAGYDSGSDEESLKKQLKELSQKKLDIFGVYVMSVGNIRINDND